MMLSRVNCVRIVSVCSGVATNEVYPDGRLIFSILPSLTSTDKSVCATRSCRTGQMLVSGKAGVAQTLLSVLLQAAESEPDNDGYFFTTSPLTGSSRIGAS